MDTTILNEVLISIYNLLMKIYEVFVDGIDYLVILDEVMI